MTTQRENLENLLQICDEILHRRRDRTGSADKKRELREKARTQLEELIPQSIAADAVARTHSLSRGELLALALLFHQRLVARNPALSGGELLGLMAEAGYSRVQAMAWITAESPLRKQGWLRAQAARDGFDPIDTQFSAGTVAMAAFWPKPPPEKEAKGTPSNELSAFADEEQYLWELLGYRNLCLHRAEALCEPDPITGGLSDRFRRLSREARTCRTTIRTRLARTTGGHDFALERFRRKHRLSQNEFLIACHLLFGEFVEGEPFAPALDCVRLVSERRTEVFRRRKLVAATSPLVQSGIIGREGPDLQKALIADLYLSDWAAEALMLGVNTLRTPTLDKRELDEFLRGDSPGLSEWDQDS